MPAWARTFRKVLLIGAGLLVLLLVLLVGTSTSGSADMYSAGGRSGLQAIVWLGLGVLLLTIPYVLASIIYAVMWASKLRGRGFRRYPGTTWILIAGPLLAALPLVALIGLIVSNTSTW
ncbi:hypothetical protein J2Y66_002043 [Paenarthrobacter nitroguajacolicus]|uniref:hypothetical protein n=1 Tax=Paenarthrobacter nitroguajacolicus TaxID=211146 RepID=UPI0028616692|nr:hypothetical protein [Paenarthrobacter nitroguajacolicus]MDR6987561.1 hypothetical protein [Paenarthrobacter nitroguajacolicus]